MSTRTTERSPMGDQGQEGKRRRGLFGRRRESEHLEPEENERISAEDAPPFPSPDPSGAPPASTVPAEPSEPAEPPRLPDVTSNEHDSGAVEPVAGSVPSAIPDGAVVRSTGGTVSPSGHVRLVTIDPAPAPPEGAETASTLPTTSRERPSTPEPPRVDLETSAGDVPAPSTPEPPEPVVEDAPPPEPPPVTGDDAAPATDDAAPEEIESGEDVTATTAPTGSATNAEAATEEAAGDESDEVEPDPFELPAILAVANQKGGWGKTRAARD